jgi:hypothetical protein
MHTSWKIAPKKSPYLRKRSNVVSSISIIAAYTQTMEKSKDIRKTKLFKELIVNQNKNTYHHV